MFDRGIVSVTDDYRVGQLPEGLKVCALRFTDTARDDYRLALDIREALEVSKEYAKGKNDMPVFASRFEGVTTLARHSLSHASRRMRRSSRGRLSSSARSSAWRMKA